MFDPLQRHEVSDKVVLGQETLEPLEVLEILERL